MVTLSCTCTHPAAPLRSFIVQLGSFQKVSPMSQGPCPSHWWSFMDVGDCGKISLVPYPTCIPALLS